MNQQGTPINPLAILHTILMYADHVEQAEVASPENTGMEKRLVKTVNVVKEGGNLLAAVPVHRVLEQQQSKNAFNIQVQNGIMLLFFNKQEASEPLVLGADGNPQADQDVYQKLLDKLEESIGAAERTDVN